MALDAFESPNWPVLATVSQNGPNIVVNRHVVGPSNWNNGGCLSVQTKLSGDIVFITIFPDISGEFLRRNLAEPVKGAVIAGYGAGNLPNRNKEVRAALAEATTRGVLLVAVTQCRHGAVSGAYATALGEGVAGAIPGGDMTWEAAYAKLAYILAQDGLTHEERRQAVRLNIRGEMTV